MIRDLATLVRYAGALRQFLAEPLGERECLELVQDQLRNRARSFLHILRHGVYENRRSPYRRLLEHAGLRYSDVAAMVERDGVETALEALYDRGVHLTLDEFKAKAPIRRPGIVVETEPRDFDNCLATEHYESRTGGSRGPRRRLLVDLDLLRHEAAHTFLLLSEFGLAGRPTGIWRELPPGIVGMKTFLRHAKLGRPVEKWFTHRQRLTRLEDVKFRVFTLVTGLLSRTCGRPMPTPEYVAPGDARRVAAWLAEKKRCGSPALLDTSPASGARVCLAARREGLDLSGTFFRFSAEPYTMARARLVHEAGCRAASHYAASEVGHIGLACGDPLSVDEVHVMADKVGVIQRRKRIGEAGPAIGSLFITTVSTNCPKTMLNVELGDYGVLEHRRCRCLLDRLGLHLHLREIRSFEKLTSEGVTFLGTEIISLVEDVLPARFGGTPLDYQFVEAEVDAIPRVNLLISPHLPRIDESEVVATVLDRLQACPGGAMMAEVWRDGGTLRVVRRAPYETAALKLLPLHIIQERDDH